MHLLLWAQVLIQIITLFSTNILQLSMFPTILLVATLFRLGLNISSTRLILGQGYAGNVIEAFGSFVVGGKCYARVDKVGKDNYIEKLYKAWYKAVKHNI